MSPSPSLCLVLLSTWALPWDLQDRGLAGEWTSAFEPVSLPLAQGAPHLGEMQGVCAVGP